MRAYYFDNLPGDQRLPHDYVPSRPVDPAKLTSLNVRFWTIPVQGHETKIDEIAKERGYRNRDTINVSKEGMGEVMSLPIHPDLFHNSRSADIRGED
jgi:1,2-dihydroxy-3-keto-5-methylthiopentene dioxygenase